MRSSLARGLASVLVTLVCCAATVRAHAPVEITQVVAYDERKVVLATNRGLILGQLAPRGFSLLCAESMPIGLDGSYRAAQLRSGRLLLASTAGLLSSDDGGCTWARTDPLSNVAITDMVLHPADPSTVFVATAGTGQVALRVSDDGGASFHTLIALSDVEYVRSLVVSAGATLSIHASGYRAPLTAADAHFVLSSSDGGASWTRFPVALAEGERDLTLLSSDAALPGVLVARASAQRPELGERALLSRDNGRSFETVATLRLLRAATIQRDGSEVLLAGVDGVFWAELAAPTFVKLGESAWMSHTQQVVETAVVCGYYDGIDAPHNGIARVRPSGFTPWFSFAEVHDVLRCPEPSRVAEKCQAAMKDFRLENERLEIPVVSLPEATDAGVLEPPIAPTVASSTLTPTADVDAGSVALMDAGALRNDSAPSETPSADAPREPRAPERRPPATSRDGCALADSRSSVGWELVLFVLAAMARGRRAARPPSSSGLPDRHRT